MVRQFHSQPALVAQGTGRTVAQVHACPIPKLVIPQYPERHFATARLVPNMVYVPPRPPAAAPAGAPRGAGRTALAAAWNLLVSDDPLLRRRMNERLDQVEYPQWSGRELAPGQVRAYGVNRPDPRMLQGKFPYWNPWQDALAGLGFGAHFQVTGNPRARELAEALATNVLQHGWLVDDRDCKVALAIRWLDGAPFTADQWLSQDRTLVQWPDGSGFALWSLPAVEIARVAALRAGDEALASKAAAIQRRLRAGRTPPRPDYPTLGGLDQLTEWDAVRWH